MRVFFIRHGQSINNYLWSVNGNDLNRDEDPELTELGLRQADLTASHLWKMQKVLEPDNRFTHIYCSLMIRAIETGRRIARKLHLPLLGSDLICEVGGIHLRNPLTGEKEGLPGKSRGYFEERFPDLILPDSVDETGWWNRPYETREEALVRAESFIKFLTQRHKASNDLVLVISHGEFFVRFMNRLLSMKEIEGLWFSMNNTGISSIHFDTGESRVEYLNRTDHLPIDLIT
jgi:2,3-bisphosphoglycerate-dependent phosphoglycerate mutase